MTASVELLWVSSLLSFQYHLCCFHITSTDAHKIPSSQSSVAPISWTMMLSIDALHWVLVKLGSSGLISCCSTFRIDLQIDIEFEFKFEIQIQNPIDRLLSYFLPLVSGKADSLCVEYWRWRCKLWEVQRDFGNRIIFVEIQSWRSQKP